MRYRFKGIVRSTGQPVEGHANGQTPDEALAALTEYGIVTETIVPDPEAPNPDAGTMPLSSAIDSAVDTAASQVPFDALAGRFKGKNVWVLDRDKIRKRVSQVVDNALKEALANAPTGAGLNDVREQVADAIKGLFKDNRNVSSQVSNTSMQMEHQIKRIEMMVHRAESVLAQMTIAIGRMGSFSGGSASAGPRRFASSGARSEQNEVLLEIFKENLRLRGISIDAPAETPADGEASGTTGGATGELNAAPQESAPEGEPVMAGLAADTAMTDLPQQNPENGSPLKQWTTNL